jgi:hypothetical protein
MKKKVYLETTIVSYLASSPSRDLVVAAHQEITREWWEEQRRSFDVYISQVVLDESGDGDREAAKRRLDLIGAIPVLVATEDVAALAEKLIAEGPIPQEAADDALHIAFAAVHGMDFLLTWNCKHLANAQLLTVARRSIRDIASERLRVPGYLYAGGTHGGWQCIRIQSSKRFVVSKRHGPSVLIMIFAPWSARCAQISARIGIGW